MRRVFLGAAMCGLLAGCVQSGVVLQVYGIDANEQFVGTVEEFASDNRVSVESRNAEPVTANVDVALVHGSDWRTMSLAWNLADRLRQVGADVSVRATAQQHHVVTAGHIAVFLRGSDSLEGRGVGYVERISQLVCTTSKGEAVILMYGDGTLEIQTYIWDGKAIAGMNYSGTWGTAGKLVFFDLNSDNVQYETTGCLPSPSRAGQCRSDLTWVSGGGSIPVLRGCDISARNILIVDDGPSW